MECVHTPVELMQDYLTCQVQEVQGHLKIVNPEEVGQNYFLRIDKTAPEVFYPNMPRSAMKSENATVPRVTVAPCLLGCLIGYFRAEKDIVEAGFEKPGKETFKGGYDISLIPFELALSPDESLVPDVGRSNEHWLVNYSKDCTEYKSKLVGKCFIGEMTYINTGAALPAMKLAFWIENTEKIFLRPDIALEPGYHVAHLFWKNMHKRDIRDLSCVVDVESVEKSVFLTRKGVAADMLSYHQPSFMRW